MNRQNKVKNGILATVTIACAVALIGGTYSRYTSTGTAAVSADIAKWSVKIGETDISTTSQTVDTTFQYSENAFVAGGLLAPGRTGYVDIVLDPSGSEVAIDYTLAINTTAVQNALETGSDSKFKITGASYKFGTGGDLTNVTPDPETGLVKIQQSLAQVTNQATENRKVYVTLNLEWDNDNDAHNASDTKEGVASYSVNADPNRKSITIPVNVTATQHID